MTVQMARRIGVGAAALALTLGCAGLAGAAKKPVKAAAKKPVKVAAKPVAKPAAAKPIPTNVCLEAEWGKLTSPVQLYKSAECSGGQGIEIPDKVNPTAEEGKPAPVLKGDDIIKFKVAKEGSYQLWGRAWWMDGCGNSFHMIVDGGPKNTISDGSYKRWHWVRGPKVHLTAGAHELKIANSEDGARLDQVFITPALSADKERVPVGKEKATPEAWVK